MSGDIQNQTERLKALLKRIEYPQQIQFDQLMQENPFIFLKIIHFVIIDYNPEFYKSLLDKDYELFSKNDLRFVEQVFKLASKELNYKPSLNITQFLSESYLEHKILFSADLIAEILKRNQRNKQLKQTIKPQTQQSNKENVKQNIDLQQQQQLQHQQQQQLQHQQQFNTVKNHYIDDNDDDDIEEPISEQSNRPKPYQLNIIQEDLQQFAQQRYQNQQSQSPQQQVMVQKEESIQNNIEYATQADLQKLMQVIMMSNENIRTINKKFSELQTTVNMALTNFSQRLSALENAIYK